MRWSCRASGRRRLRGDGRSYPGSERRRSPTGSQGLPSHPARWSWGCFLRGGAKEELDGDLAESGASLEAARSEGRRSEAEQSESDSDLALRLERSELASVALPSGAYVPLDSADLGSGTEVPEIPKTSPKTSRRRRCLYRVCSGKRSTN